MQKKYKISIVILFIFVMVLGIFFYNKSLNKNETINNNLIAIYLQDENDENNYVLSSFETIPTDGYVFNATKTNELCNGATFSYNDENNSISLSTTKSIKCNLYFDIDNSILPKEYTQLEYIESTGTQYIKTGLNISNNIKINLKWNGSNYSSNSSKIIFGHVTDNGVGGLWLGYYNNQWSYRFGLNINTTGYISTYQINTDYEIEYYVKDNTGYFKANNTTIKSVSDAVEQPDREVYLFAYNWKGNTDGSFALGKLFYISFYDTYNDNVLSYLYAAKCNNDNGCMNSTNTTVPKGTLGMYDTIRNQFYTNSGTGVFVPGPEV